MSYHRRPRPSCDRCTARLPRNVGEWNVTIKDGKIAGYLCPGCQTPEENAEAEIRNSTLDYFSDGRGYFRGRPKGIA